MNNIEACKVCQETPSKGCAFKRYLGVALESSGLPEPTRIEFAHTAFKIAKERGCQLTKDQTFENTRSKIIKSARDIRKRELTGNKS